MEIRIGTSGYHYKHWIGRYYPDDMKPAGMLAWYLRDFDTVELNNTFYHLPKESAFDSWRDAVPSDFLYAVKGSRFITHMIKLKDPDRGIVNFVPRAQRLGRKLGPILWQLPPGWNVNVERLDEFLRSLPKGIRYAFELRNQSWMTDAVLEVLKKYDAAFCIYELAGYQSPSKSPQAGPTSASTVRPRSSTRAATATNSSRNGRSGSTIGSATCAPPTSTSTTTTPRTPSTTR